MKRKQSTRKRSPKKATPLQKNTGIAAPSAATTAQPAVISAELATANKTRARLSAQLDLHTETNFFSGFSGGLSDGGLFVTTYQALEPGQPVEVNLSLPGGQMFSAYGRVAWLRSPAIAVDIAPGAGIVFDDLDPQARKLAESFMLFREPTFVDAN